MEPERLDQRREAGLRTRARLLDAALDLISDRGEDGVTLRELTDAAGANVAAVSYHFGSLSSLCTEAIDRALEHYLDAQWMSVSALNAGSTLEELAVAFARPMVHHLAAGGRDIAVLRIVARAAIDPPEAWARFDARFDEITAVVLRVLKANVSGVQDQDLILRVRTVAGMVNWLALAPISSELTKQPEEQLERLLVPIIAGAFRGTS